MANSPGDFPPSGPPPSMSPPPGTPSPVAPRPGASQPPPKKSGALKWILIGCGTILGLILIVCGAGVVFGVWGFGKLKEAAEAWSKFEKNNEQYIRGNTYVGQKLGTVTDVKLTTPRRGEETPSSLTYHVKGSRGNGNVAIEIKVEQLKPQIARAYLFFQGRKIDLETGEETAAPEEQTPPEGTEEE